MTAAPAKFWLWVFIGADTVCFVMDPSRAGKVLARHAGIDEDTGQLLPGADGEPRRLVISSDFYAVYQSAGRKADGLVNLFCWSHLRRYFVRAGDANPAQLRRWSDAWLDRIRDLYAAHGELMAAWQEAAAPPARGKQASAARLEKAHEAWDAAITVIDETRKEQAKAPGLQEPAKKALATLDRQWDGLIAHRDYPMAGLDNNLAERTIRGPVVTRKNAGGSQNPGTAGTAADIWTILATAQLAGLNPVTYLTAYLDECGRHGGKPLSGEALARSLPWNASPEDLRTWAQPPPDGKTRTSNTATGVAASDRHAEFRRALSQDFRVLTSELLPSLAVPYLDIRKLADLSDENAYRAALEWAMREINPMVSLLQREAVDAFTVFDYALDLLFDEIKRIPNTSWSIIIEKADSRDLAIIGYTAHVIYSQSEIAKSAWRKAADSGEPKVAPVAAVDLGILLTEQGDIDGARAAFQLALDSQDDEQAPASGARLGGSADQARGCCRCARGLPARARLRRR